MKTSITEFRKMIQLNLLVLLVFTTQSCETEIPPEDPTPPEFSFRITGDGFDHTFNQDTNFNTFTLMLRRGVTYNYTFTGTDQGGVDYIGWYATHFDRIWVDPAVPSPWAFRHLTGSYSSVEWYGDRSNPYTGSIVTGSFRTQGTGNDANFRFVVEDFGGEIRMPNRDSGDLSIYIGSHNTRIRNN